MPVHPLVDVVDDMSYAVPATFPAHLHTPVRAARRFMSWVDSRRRLGVLTNADTPEDAAEARKFGAEVGHAITEQSACTVCSGGGSYLGADEATPVFSSRAACVPASGYIAPISQILLFQCPGCVRHLPAVLPYLPYRASGCAVRSTCSSPARSASPPCGA